MSRARFQEIFSELKHCRILPSRVSLLPAFCLVTRVRLAAVSHLRPKLLLFVCFGCNSETMVPGHTSLQFRMADIPNWYRCLTVFFSFFFFY